MGSPQHGRGPPSHAQPDIDLDQALLYLSKYQEDALTIRQACEGFFITGEIGSGKTSGSGQALAKALLRAEGGSFGGLVCCAKPEERNLWTNYCRETNRMQDLIIIEEGGNYKFNPLDYEVQRQARGGGMTENVVALLQTITELVEGGSGQGQGDDFWDRASAMLIRNATELIILAQGKLTLEDICNLISSAPKSREEVNDPTWQESSFCANIIRQAENKAQTDIEWQGFHAATTFFLRMWAGMGDRTRSSIEATFLSVADPWLHGVIWSLFSTTTTVVPETCWQGQKGKIILLDLPTQQYNKIGVIGQSVFKWCWQKAILRRDVEAFPVPCFLWADEATNFLSSFDYEYQAVARSARAITVYLTQNIDNFTAKLSGGGAHAESETNSFISNLVTRIAHANSNFATNNKMIEGSQEWQTTSSYNTSHQGQGGTAGGSQTLAPRLLHRDFKTLSKGGPNNSFRVSAIVTQGGRIFKASNEPFLKVTFSQL